MKMFPSKAMDDYMTEMNRLFPRNNEIQPPNTSPYNHTLANRSSSSTDSTSPESFPEFHKKPDFRLESRYYSEPRSDWPRSIEPQIPESYETPRHVQRQRPIVGRKVLNDQISPAKRTEQDLFDYGNIWQPEEAVFLEQTPPKVNNIFIEQKNYSQNVFYELFSPENRGFELRTPVKTISPITVTSNSVSPLMPSAPNSRFGNLSPVRSNFGLHQPPSPKYPLNSVNFRHNNRVKNTEVTSKMCTFCRKNGETPLVYMTHLVKERVGNKQVVTCPILRSHVCSTCGATGDNAHTITYCPVLRSTNNGAPLRSTTITLKNTRVMSNGRRRY